MYHLLGHCQALFNDAVAPGGECGPKRRADRMAARLRESDGIDEDRSGAGTKKTIEFDRKSRGLGEPDVLNFVIHHPKPNRTAASKSSIRCIAPDPSSNGFFGWVRGTALVRGLAPTLEGCPYLGNGRPTAPIPYPPGFWTIRIEPLKHRC